MKKKRSAEDPSLDEGGLTARTRIRQASFRLFGEQGYSATSIRNISMEAGVSLGLVRYHYGSKEELRSEVDAWVVSIFQESLDKVPDGSPLEQMAWVNRSFATVMKEQTGIEVYLRRAFLEDGVASAILFDGLLEQIKNVIAESRKSNLLPRDVDTTWMPFQILFLHLGPLLLQPLIEPHFKRPIYSEGVIDQRSNANLKLLMYGLRGEDSNHST